MARQPAEWLGIAAVVTSLFSYCDGLVFPVISDDGATPYPLQPTDSFASLVLVSSFPYTGGMHATTAYS